MRGHEADLAALAMHPQVLDPTTVLQITDLERA